MSPSRPEKAKGLALPSASDDEAHGDTLGDARADVHGHRAAPNASPEAPPFVAPLGSPLALPLASPFAQSLVSPHAPRRKRATGTAGDWPDEPWTGGAEGYTIHDTPAIVRRVEKDLRLITDTVRLADPHLRALVLTGGFARGEGSVLEGEPQNDYDLVALRGVRPPLVPYPVLRARLEKAIDLHLDLQPVWTGRLRHVRPSIFWYETALRGRVLWGDPLLLDRLRVRSVADIPPQEGLRLLVNRAAGLLLATRTPDPHLYRIQASKGLLAALDAHLLSHGLFAPSQRERWALLRGLLPETPELVAWQRWFTWAFRFKVDPGTAPAIDAEEAWRTSARAILDAVPTALQHAGLRDLEAYAHRDATIDNAIYRILRARSVPGARMLAQHPTGRVRVATLALLQDVLEGAPVPERARAHLARLARLDGDVMPAFAALREATLQ